MKKLLPNDINEAVGFTIDQEISNEIIELQLKYEVLSVTDYYDYLMEYGAVLKSQLSIAGEKRAQDWEIGWEENYAKFAREGSFDSIIPMYHKKYNFAKLGNKIVRTFHPLFDYYLNSFVVDAIILHYARQYRIYIEFGCGPGYHLFRLNERLPDSEFRGADWSKSSQKLIKNYCAKNCLKNVKGFNFNYFSPKYRGDLTEACIFTVASLEQLGEKFKPFVNFLLRKKPKICINMEPISEVFDTSLIQDYYTKKYFEKRGYLSGYLTYLKKLEEDKLIKIHEIKRLFLGSKYVEGHTLIVWEVI